MTEFYDRMEEEFRNSFTPEASPTDDKMPPWKETQIVGKRIPRVDAFERVSGKARVLAAHAFRRPKVAWAFSAGVYD